MIFCLRQIKTLRLSSFLCPHIFGYTCRATIYTGLTKNGAPLSILKGAETSSLLARLQNKQKRSNKKVTEICPFFAGKKFFLFVCFGSKTFWANIQNLQQATCTSSFSSQMNFFTAFFEKHFWNGCWTL